MIARNAFCLQVGVSKLTNLLRRKCIVITDKRVSKIFSAVIFAISFS